MDDANLKQTGLKSGHLQEFYGFLPLFWRNLCLPFKDAYRGRLLEAAMTGKQLEFDQRVHRLNKKHAKLSRGYRATMRKDGLVVMRPQRVQSAVPAKVLLMCLVGFFAFKTFLLASLGPSAYEYRVDSLSQGTSVEQAGAWIMQIDPISAFLAAQVSSYLP
ncbi:hypothetical protein [Ruegeria lacuscaerulensis]|uniref:hypothetical protein n=1 Tax=Ruegeria lacuscaerulensis TaxID=55218 RepID=UPI001F2FBD39|nr:hypothetical protein [Ruegeria lacuscaerulensis]